VASNKQTGRTPTAMRYLEKAVESFPNLMHGADRVKDLQENQMTEEEVRYVKRHGTVPESTAVDRSCRFCKQTAEYPGYDRPHLALRPAVAFRPS